MEEKSISRDQITRKQYRVLYQKKSGFQEFCSAFLRNRLALLGLVLMTAVVVLALLADVISDYHTVVESVDPINRLIPPCPEHIFGTDEAGRDIFGRLLFGARISFRIGIFSVLLSLLVGGVFGSVAGYFGGWIDNIVMRFMDIFICLPSMLLAIAIVAAFGASEFNMLLAIAISQVPGSARIVRSAILSVRGEEYVEAARALGESVPVIIVRHVLLNCIGPIIVHATLGFAQSITTVASLSFIGLGINPPAPEWGCMLASARTYMQDRPHLVIAPGMAIFITVFACNLLGDGLRDALDPRLKQ